MTLYDDHSYDDDFDNGCGKHKVDCWCKPLRDTEVKDLDSLCHCIHQKVSVQRLVDFEGYWLSDESRTHWQEKYAILYGEGTWTKTSNESTRPGLSLENGPSTTDGNRLD